MTGQGAQRIMLERLGQTEREGWTSEHDDEHTDQSLNFAAQAYCQAAMEPGLWPCEDAPCPPMWPWEAHWFKPSEDPVHNLVRAGALIAAEIDRIERARQSDEESRAHDALHGCWECGTSDMRANVCAEHKQNRAPASREDGS